MARIVVVPGRYNLIFRITAAVLGVTAGVMVGIAFFRWMNPHVIFWGFFSALWAMAALTLHVLYKMGRLALYARHLKTMMIAGIIGQVIGVVSFIIYIVLGIVYHDHLQDFGKSYYIGAVWCFMTWKWGFAVWWFSRQYRAIILEEALIPVEEQTVYVDTDQGQSSKPPGVSA